ncbi:hypothetical protein PCL_05838 [Purpureocillium lilacinum]|uniref:Uncharacterized protein n=1 Tax=Purpureocillium lilacinum TaxID=33203 RepID=A0A2U3EL59_PURLI|nr:hypothetical protein PCL_05838 [Purpureocillium lilacinum]
MSPARAPSSLLDAVSHRPGRRRSPVAPPEFEPPPRPDQPAATPGRRLAQRREGRAAHPSPTVSVKATLEAQYRHLKPHEQLAVLRYLSRSGTYRRPYLHLPGRSASTLAAGRRLRDRRDRPAAPRIDVLTPYTTIRDGLPRVLSTTSRPLSPRRPLANRSREKPSSDPARRRARPPQLSDPSRPAQPAVSSSSCSLNPSSPALSRARASTTASDDPAAAATTGSMIGTP